MLLYLKMLVAGLIRIYEDQLDNLKVTYLSKQLA